MVADGYAGAYSESSVVGVPIVVEFPVLENLFNVVQCFYGVDVHVCSLLNFSKCFALPPARLARDLRTSLTDI